MPALHRTDRRNRHEHTSRASSRKKSPLILVVEDEDLVREAAAQILGEAGYRVLQAKTALQALRHDARVLERVRVLFTDVVLPDQGGQQLAFTLMKLYPTMKVIFTSGYPEKLNIRKAVKGSHYLQKPFSGENLKGAVRRVLRGEKIFYCHTSP